MSGNEFKFDLEKVLGSAHGPTVGRMSLLATYWSTPVSGLATYWSTTHKKLPPPRTIHEAWTLGPTVLLKGGQFLVSEVPL